MAKAKSKISLPEGWTIILSANKYAALHKPSGYQTALVEEKDDAIKLAIRAEQQIRYGVQPSPGDGDLDGLPHGWVIETSGTGYAAVHPASGKRSLVWPSAKDAVQAAVSMTETGDEAKGWNAGFWCIEEKLSDCAFRRVGKLAAGRLLDGRTWDELPANI